MDFDLTQLDTKKGADEGFDLTLLHPKTCAPLPIVISLYGFDSQVYQDALLEQQRARLKEMQKPRRRDMTPEELDHSALELLVAATHDWRGVKMGAELLPCKPENVRRIYRQFPWIREQVSDAVGDRGNVLPSGSATSPPGLATSSA